MAEYPKWIGLGGWQFGRKGYFGVAELVTSPGKIGERDECGHTHRSHREARECGQKLAAIHQQDTDRAAR